MKAVNNYCGRIAIVLLFPHWGQKIPSQWYILIAANTTHGHKLLLILLTFMWWKCKIKTKQKATEKHMSLAKERQGGLFRSVWQTHTHVAGYNGRETANFTGAQSLLICYLRPKHHAQYWSTRAGTILNIWAKQRCYERPQPRHCVFNF